jgi:hypothetical protein
MEGKLLVSGRCDQQSSTHEANCCPSRDRRDRHAGLCARDWSAFASPGWWRPLAITGAALGIVAFTAFWDGQTGLLLDEGGLGALISLIILAAAIAFPTAFE